MELDFKPGKPVLDPDHLAISLTSLRKMHFRLSFWQNSMELEVVILSEAKNLLFSKG
jgi:hypothetical protein